MNVCLPLIRSTSDELAKFQSDPDEFVSLAVDTCDKQVSRL